MKKAKSAPLNSLLTCIKKATFLEKHQANDFSVLEGTTKIYSKNG